MAFVPLLKGVVFGSVGFGFGSALVFLIRLTSGLPGWNLEQTIAVGYVFALLGWLLGVGLWESWAREWLGLPVKEEHPTDWRRYLRFTTDHKVIGVQYLVTFVSLFLLGGLLAMLMRLELMAPGRTVVGPAEFNTIMSTHGIIMIAVAVAAVIGGFGNYAVPLLIGAEDVAFPRVNALSFWLVPPVVMLLVASLFLGGYDSGWTAYPPLSEVNAPGQLLFLLAFITFGLSSILGGLNFLVTIATLRTKGMTWGRLPIFVWSIFSASIISLAATQFVAAALLLVVLDRVVGTNFFTARGGDPLLFQHLFWFYSHPAVYIMILPAFGLVLEVLAHFSRKPVFAYRWVVTSFLTVVGLSFVVWGHHLFTSGMEDYLHIPFMITTELISIPTGMVFLSALGTIWLGRLWLRTPMLFALGFVFNFVIGGVTGIFLADVPTDIHLQDTYFVVAHFHYTIVGGEIFALMAGLYYWFPKITGRLYDERLGKLHFWWVFVMYNATFIPMFQAGLGGMNRRIADYPAELAGINQFISIAAFVLGAGFLVMVYNLVNSWIRGPVASANPWQARTLEWQTSSPPPLTNFATPPVVVESPYSYGQRVGSHTTAPAPIRGGAPEGHG
jgi:cytochrome c oxidase subunit 1